MAWPTTSNPKTEFVTLRLTKDEYDDLDVAAQTAGMDRSTYVRDCVRRVRAAEAKKAARLKGKQPCEAPDCAKSAGHMGAHE